MKFKILIRYLVLFLFFCGAVFANSEDRPVCECQESYWIGLYLRTIRSIKKTVMNIPENAKYMTAKGFVKMENAIDFTKNMFFGAVDYLTSFWYSASFWAHRKIDEKE